MAERDSNKIQIIETDLLSKYASGRRKWKPGETLAFLDACYKRREEFTHSRKKRFAMQNVLEDLMSENLLAQPTTEEMLTGKLKSLIRAYKHAKKNSPTVPIPFEAEIEAILAEMPIVSTSHKSAGGAISPLRSSSHCPESSEGTISPLRSSSHCYESSGGAISPLRSNSEEVELVDDKSLIKCLQSPDEETPKAELCDYQTEKIKIKKQYYEEKLNLQQKEQDDKQKKHEEKVKAITFDAEPEEILGESTIVSTTHCLELSGVAINALRSNSQQLDPLDDQSLVKCLQNPAPEPKRRKLGDYQIEKLKIKKQYYEAKLKLQQKEREDKQKRHEEKVKILNRILDNIKN